MELMAAIKDIRNLYEKKKKDNGIDDRTLRDTRILFESDKFTSQSSISLSQS